MVSLLIIMYSDVFINNYVLWCPIIYIIIIIYDNVYIN